MVEQFARDLLAAFPDMKGLSQDNLWRMRQFFLATRQIDRWLEVDSLPKLGTPSRDSYPEKVGTLSREFRTPGTLDLVLGLSWSHHTTILGRCEGPAERCFYMQMCIRERWSVRELRRQIDAFSPRLV